MFLPLGPSDQRWGNGEGSGEGRGPQEAQAHPSPLNSKKHPSQRWGSLCRALEGTPLLIWWEGMAGGGVGDSGVLSCGPRGRRVGSPAPRVFSLKGAFLASSGWALCVRFVPTTGGWAGTQLGSVTGPYRLMEEGMCVCVCVCVCERERERERERQPA